MEQALVPARTASGKTVIVQVVNLDGRPLDGADQKVSAGLPNLVDVLDSVKDFASGLRRALAAVEPEKTTVEFTVGFAVQAGKLTALFVEGKAEGTVKVTMEWDKG
jgi:hypothetical protein